jgi:peptidoglycan/LPS O-acetylase OafA/YrhL
MKFLYYRPEVNGLRGIAVMGAVFYHAEIIFQSFRIFPGGFLGVDVFFVISGYLMTAIILKEYELTKSFSFKNYYKRRIRRLLPALLSVIFGSSVIAYLVLLPADFEEFIKSVSASIFFFSNFFYHFSGEAYGIQVLHKIPLLHTWSLSVEEQFYIIYPLVLLGLIIYLRKHIKLILIIGIISSLILASIINLNHQSFNYYMLPTRGWELLFGAMLGFNINRLSISKDKKKKEILAIFGFLILLFSFAYFDTTNDHPTYLTLIPVTATYLIIQDTNKENIINKLLSFKILIFIGLISYSFYLWHHPIFSFAKILGVGQENLLLKSLFILLSIILGFLTYRFIEKPFRNDGEQILRIGKVKILAATSVLIIIILYLFAGSQKAQYPTIAQNLYVKTWFTTKTYFKPCFQRKTFFCSFNEKNGNPTVFLVGDSIMASIQEELKDELIKKDINFIPMTNAGCDFLEINMGTVWSELGTVNNQRANCNQKIYDNRIKKINSKKGATIILHLNYIADKNEKKLKNFSKRVLNYLNNDYKIILVYPIPQMSKNVSSEIEKDIKNNKSPVNLVDIDFSKYLNESKKIYKLFDTINHKNLYKIYPHKNFCNTIRKEMCIGNTYEHIYFSDTAHLSKKGSELINIDLAKIIDKIY